MMRILGNVVQEHRQIRALGKLGQVANQIRLRNRKVKRRTDRYRRCSRSRGETRQSQGILQTGIRNIHHNGNPLVLSR